MSKFNTLKKDNSGNQDVDFLLFIKKIWDGKYYIISFAALFAIVGLILSSYSQSWWTSKETIGVSPFYSMLPIKKDLTSLYMISADAKKEVNDVLSTDVILTNFIQQYSSTENKKEFLINTTNLDKKAKGNGFIRDWAKKIKVNIEDGYQRKLYVLSFQAMTADSSYELLTNYIDFIKRKQINEMINDINEIIKYRINMNESNYSQIKQQAERDRIGLLLRTESGLKIAEKAKVISPMPELNYQQFPVDIGVNGLMEQKKIIQGDLDASYFRPELLTIKDNIKSLKNIKLSVNEKALEIFQTLESAEVPLNKDTPNRKLIVLFSLVIGGLFGAVVVLLKSILTTR